MIGQQKPPSRRFLLLGDLHDLPLTDQRNEAAAAGVVGGKHGVLAVNTHRELLEVGPAHR